MSNRVNPDPIADRFDFLHKGFVDGARYNNVDDFLRHIDFLPVFQS
jgi:hypothetical protein